MALFLVLPAASAGTVVKHYEGLPSQLGGGPDSGNLLPSARMLVIQRTSEGYFLFRVGEAGSDAGDTLHRSIDDAREQARFEFGVSDEDWQELSATEGDPVQQVVQRFWPGQ